ncbi:MAG: lipoate--protein ligase family protein [Candidatus Omnitrophica bacterium]|nr:lipoate--protein ligase family protein [Candidatus Omnitrophota bacterium]
MSVSWRIIDTGPMDPAANMAFDEAILQGYQCHSSPPTLRIYGWKNPGLSLGYSQDPEQELDIEFCRKVSMPFVRRITGGGIILHGNELTYSLVCSKSDLSIPAHVLSSYKIISSFLIAFYNALGIKARFACDVVKNETLSEPSAICFAAKEKYDIVSGGRKIGGSAQKRTRGVIFQHGSIPFNFDRGRALSFSRAELPRGSEYDAVCLEEVLGRGVNAADMSKVMIRAFTESFDIRAEVGGLSSAEEECFSKLKTMKYESSDWNFNRIDRLRA